MSATAVPPRSFVQFGPMRFIRECLPRRQAASEIVSLDSAEDARRGRYDPCGCRSGRKWEHCHGAAA